MQANDLIHFEGNILKYKGYYAIPQYSAPDRCFYGKLAGISDCILFEGRTVEELEQSFKDSVDIYLENCKEENIEPQKPFSGKFNLRMPPDIQALAAGAAAKKGTSVNQFILDAIIKAVRE